MQVAEELESMDARKLATAMACCFWGTLVVVLDIEFNGVDFVHDAIGWAVALIGVRLVVSSGPPGVGVGLLRFCTIMAVVGVVASLLPGLAHADGWSWLMGWASGALWIAAAVAFCVAMTRLTRAVGWRVPGDRWLFARHWVVWAWAAPWLVGWVLASTTDGFHASAPWLVVVLLVVLFAPLLVMLVAMWSTRRAAIAAVA